MVMPSEKNLFEIRSIIGNVMLITGYATDKGTFFNIANHVTILVDTMKI
jgi:hypothetical protein